MNQDGQFDASRTTMFGISAKEAGKEIAYGSIAGMVAEVFEYPFDLAKVRLQAQLLHPVAEGSFKGPLHCLNQTWREEGLRGLYRGVSVPLMGSMAYTAALFFTYSSFQHGIQNYHNSQNRNAQINGHSKTPLTIPQMTLAAAGAGFMTSFILTPMELVKCRMQVQMMNRHSPLPLYHLSPISSLTKPFFFSTRPSTSTTSQCTAFKTSIHTTRRYTPLPTHIFPLANTHAPVIELPGPTAIIRSIFRDHGPKGFWLGQTGTILRETGGTAVWFVSKEVVADALKKRRYRSQAEINFGVRSTHDMDILPWESVLSGAVAGGAATLLFYPADTVKSAIQTEKGLGTTSLGRRTPRPTTFWRVALQMYHLHGPQGFYAGCGMTVARSVLSSGLIFMVYDGLQQRLG